MYWEIKIYNPYTFYQTKLIEANIWRLKPL